MSGKKDPLSKGDRARWDAVAKTVRPLGARPDAPDPPKAPRIEPARDSRLPDEWFLGDAPVPNQNVDRKTRRHITKGRQDVDRTVDLHGMTQDRAFATLARVIEGSIRRGDKTLLVVTGKGGKRFSQTGEQVSVAYRTRNDFEPLGGVLKRMVPLWLSGPELKPFVHSYGPAAQEHGGEGALYVILRRKAPGTGKS